jgi:hypothetical protein
MGQGYTFACRQHSGVVMGFKKQISALSCIRGSSLE